MTMKVNFLLIMKGLYKTLLLPNLQNYVLQNTKIP